MKNKLIAWALIIIGAVPVLVNCLLYMMARLDYSITIRDQSQYDFYVKYGIGTILTAFFAGILMIVIGTIMLKKEKQSSFLMFRIWI